MLGATALLSQPALWWLWPLRGQPSPLLCWSHGAGEPPPARRGLWKPTTGLKISLLNTRALAVKAAVTRGPRFQAKNSCGQCHGGVQPRTVTPGWWQEGQRAAVQPGRCRDRQCGCSGCQFGGFPVTPSQKEAQGPTHRAASLLPVRLHALRTHHTRKAPQHIHFLRKLQS